ncbi:MAG: FtsX-like permease family protein, partial [bacterium]
PGASLEALRSDLAVVATRMREQYPAESERGTATVVPLREAMVGDSRAALIAVMGAAALVLVITCINIAGLFLARASARRRELAVRGALGAGRSRLVQQLLTESAVYGLAGGVLGIGLAYTAEGVLAKVAASSLPNLGPIRIDAGVLAFAVIVSLVCGFAFGLMPALAATRVDLKESLSESSRGASQSGLRARGTQTLVVAQIALAIMLMVGAGLLVRSFASLTRTNLGFSTGKDVLTFRVNLLQRVPPAERNVLFASILERVRGLPSVKQAGLAEIGPWNGPNGTTLRREGVTDPDASLPMVLRATATEDFFSAVGMQLRRGRAFNAGDRFGAPGVVIVSEGLAREIFGTVNPIGQRLKLNASGLAPDSAAPWREVVGVVGDVRGNVQSEPTPTVYVSDWQEPGGGADFVVRTTGEALVIVPGLRRILHDLAPTLPLINPRTLNDVLSGFITQQRLAMALMGAFATLALLLAALGVYAVMAYAVTARTREFGIRSALGARREMLLLMVVRQGMRTALIGTAIGIVFALMGSKVLTRLLSGVSPRDGLTFVSAAGVLLVVTFVACLIPARVATRVQPVEALRAE